ncbi:hypothetical protein GQ53DRAFT_826631 [Thozetella sp. PMI_491]|nr:hypothetical protein GQ53DRAFT_826631 [Thozetella sp. PMI_491]
MRQTTDWERIMYIHPSCHQPGTGYSLEHDIYSLGIVLLEVSLWQSVLRRDDVMPGYVFDDAAFIADHLPSGRALCEKFQGGIQRAGEELKAQYEIAAGESLPQLMGHRFRDAVLYCLDAVDDGARRQKEAELADLTVSYSGGVGNARSEAIQEEAIGLRYIDEVLAKLDEIQL